MTAASTRGLKRILQVCAKEIEKNSAMWGTVTVPDLVNHVLDYIAWALDHEKVEGRGVTIAWLEKGRGGNGCGAMRMVMAKIYLRIFIETLVEDLPGGSIAKQGFLGVLPHFSSYAVFGKTFGTGGGGASAPAATSQGDTQTERTDAIGAMEVDDPFSRIKEKSAGVVVKLLEFMFDLFSQTLDDKLLDFLTSDANANQAVSQVKWEEWQQPDLVEIRRTMSLHRMTVPASECSPVPAASTRGLKRSLSAADDDGPGDEDVNDREKEIAKERAEAWGQAQAFRRKWVSASCIKGDRMTKEHLDNWWGKQTAANQFQGEPGKSHRLFVLSGERWGPETGSAPWVDEPQPTASLDMALDWILERKGPCDTILVFDGRSSSIRAKMEKKMQSARHVSEIWIVYQPRREAKGRKTVFGSRNREVGWVSFPVSRTRVPTQERKAARSTGNEWETTTFSSTFSSMVPMAWGQLPSITLADKQRIIGASVPVPPSKVFDTDLGCPLCWQDVKSKDLWLALLEATNADFVVDLGAGSGITARACLALGIPWAGLCWNQVHTHWLNNVVDRWALQEIVQKTSPLHEQDLAKLVSAHFSDVLQQIADRDQNVGDTVDDDDDDDDDGAVE